MDLKAIIEISSVIAILVGLIFVGLELKQNTEAVQSQTNQGILDLANQQNNLISADADLAELYVRANENLDALTKGERLRYRLSINSMLNVWQHSFYSHANGTMDEELWQAYNTGLRDLVCAEASNQIWREIEVFFGAQFRFHANSTTKEQCAESSALIE